jgi:hypothetical protein
MNLGVRRPELSCLLATVNPLPDNQIVAMAYLDIKLFRYNLIYGQTAFFEKLNIHLVVDLLCFQLKILAK